MPSEAEFLARVGTLVWVPVDKLDEAEKVVARSLLKQKRLEFHNGVLGLAQPTTAPIEEDGYEATGGIRREAVRRARAAATPAAAVYELAKLIWGYDRPVWPLYGKFGGKFSTRDQLALFCISKALAPYEGDPIAALLPLAVAISDEPTKEELAARRKDIADNAANLAAMKARANRRPQ